MDAERFDAILRRLAVPAPRRAALRAFGAGALGAVLFGREREAVGAAEPVRCAKAGCDEVCRDAVDPRGGTCACVKLTSGNRICVVAECGKRCTKRNDCGKGEVCAKTASRCCNRASKGVCVTPCKAGTPGEPEAARVAGWARQPRLP